MSASMHDEFRAFLKAVRGAKTIGELAAGFMASRAIGQEYREKALRRLVAQDLRKFINRERGADGLPIMLSVVDVDDETGQAVRRYKQLDLFNREDYVRAWWEADAREKTARHTKRALEKHHDRRHIDQQPLRRIVHEDGGTLPGMGAA